MPKVTINMSDEEFDLLTQSLRDLCLMAYSRMVEKRQNEGGD